MPILESIGHLLCRLFLAVACLPFHFVMHEYGARLRVKCKYVQEAAVMIARMQMKSPSTKIAKDEDSV